MKKKVLTIAILFTLALFVGMNKGVCENVTVVDQTANVNYSTDAGTYVAVLTDGITGNEMQAIKVTAYRKNGTKIPNVKTVYVKLYDGYANKISSSGGVEKYQNTCSCGDSYNFSKMPNKSCTCSTNNTVEIISVTGVSTNTKYWAINNKLYSANGTALTDMLCAKSGGKCTYNNINNILDKMGYRVNKKYPYYEKDDYLIIEPYVTISCVDWVNSKRSSKITKSNKEKYISGTINSLIGANMSFYNGTVCGEYQDTSTPSTITIDLIATVRAGRFKSKLANFTITKLTIELPYTTRPQKNLYKWFYSSIAQTFKSTTGTCYTTSEYRKNTNPKLYLASKDSYSGCGYDQYSLNSVVSSCVDCNVDEGGTPCTTKEINGKKYYYGINGKLLSDDSTKTAAEKKTEQCHCIVQGTTYYVDYNHSLDNKGAVDETTFKLQCTDDSHSFCLQTEGNRYPTARITLYENCKEFGCSKKTGNFAKVEYRNLLNFTSSGADACSNGTPYTLTKNCLEVTGETTFSRSNLSQYTEIIDIDSNHAYCNYAFSMERNVLPSPWSSTSGMAYLGGAGIQGKLATAKLTLKCYLYLNSNKKLNEYKKVDPFASYNYSTFVGDVSFDNIKLTPTIDSNSGKLKVDSGTVTVNTWIEYSKEYTAYYYLPLVYVNEITGIISSKNTSGAIVNYGFYSKLDDEGTYNVDFNIDFKKNVTLNNNSNCKYIATKKFIDIEPQIEFRTIDPKKPFIGENGKGRITGSNWCDSENCSSDNAKVQQYIYNRNDSYNSKRKSPMYKFVITDKTIQTIRNSNKILATTNDNSTKCVNDDKNCKANFFKSISSSIKVSRKDLTK